MSESEEIPESFDNEQIEALLSNVDGVLDNKDQIELGLEQSVDSGLRYNNYEPLIRSVGGPLYGDIEGEERSRVSEAILNITAEFPDQLAAYISENNEQGEELVIFLNKLEARFRIKVRRIVNRQTKGNDWWSNITSNSAFRGGRPVFYHEITKDYEERVVVSSDLQNTLVLSRHFLNQVEQSRNELGEDILDYVPEDVVNDIVEIAQDLVEAVEDYPESVELPEEDDTDDGVEE